MPTGPRSDVGIPNGKKMLTYFAITAAIFLIGAAVVQGAIAVWFRNWFVNKKPVVVAEDQQQHVAVIMSVRGCDPTLRNSLTGVLQQDYSSYEVHLVVDHRTDEAWEVVHAIQAESDDRNVLIIHELSSPRETCSLKCHAIVQALESVSEKTKVIALLDADVAVHKTWLRELTAPLVDPSVGGVTGNQWFEPEPGAGIGSLTRSTWNGGALVPTIFFSNPWAGSFAMRLADVEASELKSIWSRSIVDDGPIQSAINGIGLRIEFAPSLIMINRESCTFSYVNRWVTRMLTWSRLYEKTFFLSVIHAAFSNGVMLANFLVLILAIAQGHALAIGISTSTLLISGLLSTVSYLAARSCVKKSCELRGETLPSIQPARFVGVLLMVAIAHLVYGVSCARALVLKQIKWRDISYRVKKHDDVKRLNYHPFVRAETNSDVSI